MPEEKNRSLGELIKALTADMSTLIRSEIALAKLEVRHSVQKLGIGGIMFVAAGFLAICGVIFLLVTGILGLVALGVPAWLSTLIFAILVFVIAGILVMLGRKKMRNLELVPKASVESVKTDINTLRSELKKPRRSNGPGA